MLACQYPQRNVQLCSCPIDLALPGPSTCVLTNDKLAVQSIDLSNNMLTGTVPAFWAESIYLKSLDLSSNSLS